MKKCIEFRKTQPIKIRLPALMDTVILLRVSGTTKIKNLDENIGSLIVKLSKEDLKEISDAVPIEEVAGGRFPDIFDKSSWRFANTPPKGQ